MNEALAGVVLAGGRSSRFGSPKSLADWSDRTVIERVIETLLPEVSEVVVVVKAPADYALLATPRVRVVLDRFARTHALGGICTGLEAVGAGHAFVCACDMPLLWAPLVRRLWELRGGHDAVVPVWEGKPQGLCAIYRRDCAPRLAALIARGQLRVEGALDALSTRWVAPDEWSAIDPEGLSFFDIDTPADHARARKRA